MTSSATALAGKNEIFNFVNVFNNTETTSSIPAQERAVGDDGINTVIGWLESSGIATIIPTTATGNRLVLNDPSIVTFGLQEAYKNSFVLLRGLLEFSRPRGVQVFANAIDRTFQVRISAGQAGAVTTYLDTIFGWLLREIRFKTSLKAVIRFEDRVRQLQASLYQSLSASL